MSKKEQTKREYFEAEQDQYMDDWVQGEYGESERAREGYNME